MLVRNSITISDSTIRWPTLMAPPRCRSSPARCQSRGSASAGNARFVRSVLARATALYTSSQRMVGLVSHYPEHCNHSLG